MNTFDKIKAAYISGAQNWTVKQTAFHCTEIARAVGVLAALNRYILPAYDLLFVETENGTGWITCVSDTGIRVEYFEGNYKDDSEWIDAATNMGNMNATKRTFVEQPANILQR